MHAPDGLEGDPMSTAKIGDRVRIQYSRLPERAAATGGSGHQKTIEFTVGSREVFRALSVGVVGMAPGERKQFSLRPHKSRGSANPRFVRSVRRTQIAGQIELYVGKRLTRVRGDAGLPRRVTVIEIRPDTIIVDGNHPLAGKAIEREVCLLSLDSSSNANRNKHQFDIGGES